MTTALPRIVLVTGAGSGIGRGIALAFAADGDHVVVLDRDPAAAAATVALVAEAGGTAEAEVLDVSDVASVRAVTATVAERHGRIDVLVNNAGVARARPFLDYEEGDWELMLGVNVKGAFFLQQAVARHMIAAGGGKVVNIASTAAFVSSSTPESIYDLSKGAVRQLTVSTAVELAPHGVNVNAVAPGTIATDLTLAVLDTPEKLAKAGEKIPAKRLGQPADIARAVLFLASSAADYVHGHTLVVDGGWLLE
jgi:NAD(P)-dependent dehydrogenase (short-subunit alcohol dehydrogenase family)